MLIKVEVDQRRSFSFSSLDFNSSFDEDESSIVDQEGVYSDNDDAYIEINLNRPPQSTGAKSEEKKEEGDDDLEFRVSFLEAALPFIGISSPPSNSYYSLPAVEWPPVTDKRKVPLFLPVNHLLNTLEGSPADESMGDDRCRNSAISNTQDSKQLVLRMSRNGSRTGDGGGMMNMMIKFRYVMSFRWMVTSMLKIRRQQRQAVASSSPSSSTSGADSSSNNQKTIKIRKKPPRQQVIGASNNAAEKSRSSALLLRLGLDAIRGVVASDHKIGGRRRRGDGVGKHSKSCPGSIKSSPLHHQGGGGALVYSKDSSVQAAIAHCKKSFGRSEDFSF